VRFHNKKVIIDGITFDSQVEGRRYIEIKAMKQAGIISEYELQPRFTLLEPYRKCPACHHKQIHIPKTRRKSIILCQKCGNLTEVWSGVDYYADFKLTYPDGTIRVEDVKGSAEKRKMPAEFKVKWQFFEAQNPGITLHIVVMPPLPKARKTTSRRKRV